LEVVGGVPAAEITPPPPVTESAAPAAETPITFVSPIATFADVEATVNLTVARIPWASIF